MKPREFKLEVFGWRTNAVSWDESNPNQLKEGEVIRAREVIPERYPIGYKTDPKPQNSPERVQIEIDWNAIKNRYRGPPMFTEAWNKIQELVEEYLK